ncbi:MAG: hypothetical protein PHX65_07990 [Sulfurimonas sp.]|nr:hypothetical protein [Sulfurimonas sp.]
MKLEETIKQLPDSAGIYQYFDKEGHLLYIGKAKSLAKRDQEGITVRKENQRFLRK